MATMKDVALASGYSLSTVSIVIRGDAEKRHIPKSTQTHIYEVAASLGYMPNVSARRLRKNTSQKNVAVFWTTDYRSVLVSRFLRGIQQYIADSNSGVEVTICPYTPDQLNLFATPQRLQLYSAVIICTASDTDLAYIESVSCHTPVILYNRTPDMFSTVVADNAKIGAMIADAFHAGECKRSIVVTDRQNHLFTQHRVEKFLNALQKYEIPADIVRVDANTITDGRLAGERLVFQPDVHYGIFTTSDLLGIGVLRACINRKISIPDTLEIISIGSQDTALYDNLDIPLAVIDIPIQQMGYHCLQIANDLIEHSLDAPVHKVVECCPHYNGSCRYRMEKET